MEWIKGNLLSFDQKLVDKLKESYPEVAAEAGFAVMPVEFSFSYDNGLYNEDKSAFGIAILITEKLYLIILILLKLHLLRNSMRDHQVMRLYLYLMLLAMILK